MRKTLVAIFGASVLAAATAVPAEAAPLAVQGLGTTAGQQSLITNVQWRDHGWRGHGWHGPRYGYYRRGWHGHRYGYDPGAAAAAGIVGLATGAIVGGALANQQQAAPVVSGDAVAYCEQRFRSYDPASGTYLGYDGVRHPCP